MSVKLSPAAAKDFSKGMNSMEKTSKSGGFLSFSGMLDKMIEATPAMEIIGSFMELWAQILTKDIDWQALIEVLQEVTEKVSTFKDDLDELDETLGISSEQTGLLNQEQEDWLDTMGANVTGIQVFTDNLKSMQQAMEAWGKWFEDSTNAAEAWRLNFLDNLDDALNAATDRFLSWILSLIPGGGGGGGGGGDGGDDFDPLDPSTWF